VPVKSLERSSFQHPKILDKKLPLKQAKKSKATDIESLKQKRRLVQYEQRWRQDEGGLVEQYEVMSDGEKVTTHEFEKHKSPSPPPVAKKAPPRETKQLKAQQTSPRKPEPPVVAPQLTYYENIDVNEVKKKFEEQI